MIIITFISIMLLIVTGAGCATRNIYDGLRMHQGMECQNLQGPERDECENGPG